MACFEVFVALSGNSDEAPRIDNVVMKRAAFIALAALGMTRDSTFFASAEAQLSRALTPNGSARAAASLTSDLTFPDEAEPASALTSPRMAMLRPDEAGPFPAMVLFHQCSGLNAALVDWAKQAVARGFVVLLIDSLGPRHVQSVCGGPKAGVNFARGTRDALQAAERLRGRLRRQKPGRTRRLFLGGDGWVSSLQPSLCRLVGRRAGLCGGGILLSRLLQNCPAQRRTALRAFESRY